MTLPTKGALAEISFIEILKDALRNNLTGMVRMETGTVIKVVYLQQGTIAFASSNEKSDRLTEVLKRAGKLTPEQIEHAQSKLKPNVSMGKTLVELGYISPKDLLWGARMQVEGILHHLLFWNQGNYQILEGPLPKEIVSLNLPIPQVIFDGILRSQDRHWVLQQIGSPEAVYTMESDFHEKNAQYKLAVDAVVSRMNGKRSLEEIADHAQMDAFEVCKIAAALHLLQMVKRIEKPVQMPLLVAETEQQAEAAADTVMISPGNVSLGEVLQIPTVEELQQESEEYTESRVLPTLQIPTEYQAQEPQTGESDFSPTVSIQPPEPEPESSASIPPSEEAAIQETPQTEIISPEGSFAYKKPFVASPTPGYQPPPSPLQPFTFVKRKKYPGLRSVNWRKMAILMIVIALLATAGGAYYWYSTQNKIASLPPPKVKPIPKWIEKQPQDQHIVEPEPAPVEPESVVPEPAESQKPPITEPTATEPAVQQPQPPTTKPIISAPPKVQSVSPLDLALEGKLNEAAALWKKELQKHPARLTIQLEIACQEKTVFEAINLFHRSTDLRVVSLDFKGRPCYRVLYGMFSTESQAKEAQNNLPAAFLNQQSPPQAIPISKILK